MRILQVNVVYRRGSTGKITYDLHTMLKQAGHESLVCYGRKEAPKEPGVYKVSSEFEAKLHALSARLGLLQYSGSYISTSNLLSLIKQKKPDIVHLQCLNGYFVNIYRLLTFLKINNIPTVLTLHAEFMYTGNCGHALDCTKWISGCKHCPQVKYATTSIYIDRTAQAWNYMKEAFKGFDNLIVVSVSEWVEERARQSPILTDKIFKVIYNGINTDIFKPTGFDEIKKKHCLTDEKILLFVTVSYSSELKGGRYITELAKRLINDKTKIIVIGFDGDSNNLPKNIIALNHTDNQMELAQYYSMADLTLLTSKRETFSMIVAESLCCGTPVVGFKAGAPERIALKEFSEFVEYGNIDALICNVYKWINKKDELSERLLITSKNYYSKEKMCEGYVRIYELLFGRKKVYC